MHTFTLSWILPNILRSYTSPATSLQHKNRTIWKRVVYACIHLWTKWVNEYRCRISKISRGECIEVCVCACVCVSAYSFTGGQNEFIARTGKGCHWLSISMMLVLLLHKLLYLFPHFTSIKTQTHSLSYPYIMNAFNDEWSNFYVILLCVGSAHRPAK